MTSDLQTTASPVAEDDSRKIVRLLGEIITMRGGCHEKRQALMTGLSGIIGADAWAWSLVHFEHDQAPRQILTLHGGFDQARLAKWAIAIEHPQMKPVTDELVAEAMISSRGFTRRDVEFVPESWWDSENLAFKLWQEANFRSFILSAWPTENGGFSGIGIYRNADRPHFGPRESQIAHLVFSEIPWLHVAGLGKNEGRQLVPLYPRHRTVLNLLCEGWSRKKIASHLGLGVNTIHGYAKGIFKHFQVHSQAELISRLTKVEVGDRR